MKDKLSFKLCSDQSYILTPSLKANFPNILGSKLRSQGKKTRFFVLSMILKKSCLLILTVGLRFKIQYSSPFFLLSLSKDFKNSSNQVLKSWINSGFSLISQSLKNSSATL